MRNNTRQSKEADAVYASENTGAIAAVSIIAMEGGGMVHCTVVRILKKGSSICLAEGIPIRVHKSQLKQLK